MISASPSSLNYKNDKDELPIHTATHHLDSIRHIPLLAKEGMKHKVGGKDGRGGLLVADLNMGLNTLQLLVLAMRCPGQGNAESDLCDKPCVDVMKELKDSNLLTKDDIKNHDFLYHTTWCHQGCKQRFEFLCDWCPEGLKDYQCMNLPIIHTIINSWSIESFAMLLKAATKHHTNEAGLLFQTDNHGITACQRAFNKYGKDKATMQVIGNCIPFDDPQIPRSQY